MNVNHLFFTLSFCAAVCTCSPEMIEFPDEVYKPADAVPGVRIDPDEDQGSGDEGGEGQKNELVNSSYIRGDFFDLGRISGASLATCNDLIYITIRPYADGEAGFVLPDNSGTLTGGAGYEARNEDRRGVVTFDGTGTMECGGGLLDSPDGPCREFGFGTYLKIDEWVKGAFLFRKRSGKLTTAALRLGQREGEMELVINGTVSTAQSDKLKAGSWIYLGVTYKNSAADLFVKNFPKVPFAGKIPAQVPNMRGSFQIGEKFKGSMDETCLSAVAAPNLGKNPVEFTSWNNTKVLAYWKYDMAGKPGHDSHSWKTRLESIREALNEAEGGRRLRLGAAGGQWKEMAADHAARTRFADNCRKIIEDCRADGLDIDFEWACDAREYENLSKTLLTLRSALGKDRILSVSLHPVSYALSKEAVDAVDFISYQCYGPSTDLFPYDRFVSEIKNALDYGIPAAKLLPGVPFYGTTGKAEEQEAYYTFVKDGGLADRTADQFSYKGRDYVLNSQATLRKKARYVCENGLAGIMSWDLATDVDVTDDMSLLKAIAEEFDSHRHSRTTRK